MHDLNSPLQRLNRYARWRASGKPNGVELMRQLRELLKDVDWGDDEDIEIDVVAKTPPVNHYPVTVRITDVRQGKPKTQEKGE